VRRLGRVQLAGGLLHGQVITTLVVDAMKRQPVKFRK
jgi:hypothetical protein